MRNEKNNRNNRKKEVNEQTIEIVLEISIIFKIFSARLQAPSSLTVVSTTASRDN